MKELTKSIRMAVRIYSINNGFLARKGLLRLCENVAARWAYKVYQNGTEGLLNQYCITFPKEITQTM